MKQKIIAGNWKMNKTIYQSIEFIQDLKTYEFNENKRVIICPPYTSLYTLSVQVEGSCIKLGAQNMHHEEQGAYTGEISSLMLLGSNVEYAIVGHSERRQYFNETDEIINKKVLSALKHGLKPILCIGETLDQREQGKTADILKAQILSNLKDVPEEEILRIVIAYEPIWAIGTGKTATPEQADEGCKVVRDTIKNIYNNEIADNIYILYGGSVNVKNAKELFVMPNIDGGLVGGASLKASDFAKIINYEE